METDVAPIPRLRDKHHSYDESVDEAPAAIEKEQVDVERSTPAEENEPVEGGPEGDRLPPVFEE